MAGTTRLTRAPVIVLFAVAIAATSCTDSSPSASVAPSTSLAERFSATAIAFSDMDHGVAIGSPSCQACNTQDGMVARTNDGGRHWKIALRTPLQLTSVSVLGRWAWIEGRGVLLTSEDRGSTWTTVPGIKVKNASFATPDVGWAIAPLNGAYGTHVVSTTDGGRTWVTSSTPCSNESLNLRGFPGVSAPYVVDVSLASPAHGIVLCGGSGAGGSAAQAIYETHDGGVHWSSRWAGWDTDPGGAQFLSDGTIWRWSFDLGPIKISVNGGRTWRTAPPNRRFADASPLSASLVDGNRGYVLYGRLLYRTRAGGRSWTLVTKFAGRGFRNT